MPRPKSPRQLFGKASTKGVSFVEFVPANKAEYQRIVNEMKNSGLFFEIKKESPFYILYHRVVGYSRHPFSDVKKRFQTAKKMY